MTSRPGVLIVQVATVFALPVVINIATNTLPDVFQPFEWLAWPAAVGLAVVIIRTSLRRKTTARILGTRLEVGRADRGGTWNIPEPTRAFLSRPSMVNRLDRVLASSLPRASLVGMPGVGKSESASAYAHGHRGVLGVGWWIVADSRLAVVVALAALADRLGLSSDDQEQSAAHVVDILGDRDDALLVYDNVDSPEVLAGLLPTGRCRVVVTSRNPAVERLAERISVEPFTRAQAMRFLRLRTADNDKNAAERLADLTGGLPLALEQIAGYCAAAGIGLTDYADRYQDRRNTLLREQAPAGRASVEVAIGLALADVRRKSIAGTQLVRLASYLAHVEGVPRDLLTATASTGPKELAAIAADPIELDRAIAAVRRTSLVSAQDRTLRIHPLVGDILRDRIRYTPRWRRIARMVVGWIPLRDATAGWSEQQWIIAATGVIMAALPSPADDAATWPRWTALLPHALACIEHARAADVRTMAVGYVCNEFGLYLRRRGEYTDALYLFERAVSNYGRSAGRMHPATLSAMNNLADSYLDHGRIADAIALQEDTH